MTGPSAEETVELMRAMGAVNVKIPTTQLAIADNSLPPDEQTRFGQLLIDLGHLVQQHAEHRRGAITPHTE